jgi:predicted component of type VI protein secretion system
LINKDREPRFTNDIARRIEKVPLPGTRQETSEQLRDILARDIKEIFNTELLKIEKYQERYKKAVQEYVAAKSDPHKAAKAEKPGPVIEVVFKEFSFN